MGKLLVKLLEPSGGSIFFRFAGDPDDDTAGTARDSAAIKGRLLRSFRRQAQMIFQDPYESMNPRRTIYDIISEPLSVQGIGDVQGRIDRVLEILALVGLTPAGAFLFRHPHELSGGQRQRIAIARALVIRPSFVVADEPTSMLDVSSRTGVMSLMQELGQELGVAYLYVTHDLAVARYMCHRIAVMYLGKVVELAETEELLRNPLHPYTRALLSAVPLPDPEHRRQAPDIRGDLATPIDPPSRCRFYDRCPAATAHCLNHAHPPTEEKTPRASGGLLRGLSRKLLFKGPLHGRAFSLPNSDGNEALPESRVLQAAMTPCCFSERCPQHLHYRPGVRYGLGVGAQATVVQRRRGNELQTIFRDVHFPQGAGQAQFPAQGIHSLGRRQSGLFVGHSTLRHTDGFSYKALAVGAGVQVVAHGVGQQDAVGFPVRHARTVPPTWWQVAVFKPSPPKEAREAMAQAVLVFRSVSMSPSLQRGRFSNSNRMA